MSRIVCGAVICGVASQCGDIELPWRFVARFVVATPSYNLHLDPQELVISVAFSSSLHSSIDASGTVLLSHDCIVDAMPPLTLWMLPRAFMDVFLVKPVYRCLVQRQERQKLLSSIVGLFQSVRAPNIQSSPLVLEPTRALKSPNIT